MDGKTIRIASESARCLLCQDGACTAACANAVPVDRIIRALRFENLEGALALLPQGADVGSAGTQAQKACCGAKLDRAVDIEGILKDLASIKAGRTQPAAPNLEPDLAVEFCGIRFDNPFRLSSSVVASDYEMVAKAFEMGWAGAAFKTINCFVPKEVSPRCDQYDKEGLGFLGFKNIEQISDHPLEENLGFMRRLKRDYPTKRLVVSIMGRNEHEWTYLARAAQDAGADIIECNFSCPHMAGNGLGSDVGTNPELVATYTRATRRGTSLPILAKMTPNITNMEVPARAAIEAGADGIAAINTIKSVLDVDLHSFVSAPNVAGKSAEGGYSGKAVKPIALRFINDLHSDDELSSVPISGMGGIETWRDAAEFMALGCGTIQVTTAVMQYGYRIIDDLIDGMRRYLAREGYGSVSQIVGRASANVVPADELDRNSIQYPRFDRDECVGCGRCELSCFDGGHQAIVMRDGTPHLLGTRCVGCQLCVLVCPACAIKPGRRVAKRPAAKDATRP